MSCNFIRYALLAALVISPVADALELRPDQKAAVEKLLKGVDPASRQMVRPQIEQSISMMTPEQVAMFVDSMGSNSSQEESVEEEPEQRASPEDLEYNRAQYEPVLRKHWEVRRSFDQFVDAELQSKCPNPDKYAVYREVERYELMPVSANWHRAGDNVEAEVHVIGGTYAPQDGRYKFDFSKVRMSFDKAAVSAAIAEACAEWTQEAIVFKEKASKLMYAGQSDAAFQYERAAQAKVSKINQKLEAALDAQAPARNYNADMMMALQNPTRVK